MPLTIRLLPLAAALGLAFAANPAGAQIPKYDAPQLQARTNLLVNDNGWNLPPGSSFNSITVDMNDNEDVTFRVQIVPGRDGMSVWFGANGAGALVCDAENNLDAIISDPKINTAGNIVFGQYGGTLDGIYSCNAATGAVKRLTASPIGASSWGTPEINDSGEIGYRAGFGSGRDAWVSLSESQVAYHAAVIGIDPQSPYDFLFTPSFNNQRLIAGVVRRANPGEPHREIRIFDAKGNSELVAENIVGSPDSPYVSFQNSVGFNDGGNVAFTAILSGNVKAVYRSDGETTVQIARQGEAGITDIDAFPPSINASGLVAFRGSDTNGQAIFVSDGKNLRRVIGRGDSIDTDLGPAQLGQNDNSPVFGGAVAFNSAGSLAFTAALHPEGNNQVEWGTGVIILSALIDDDTIFISNFESETE